MYSAPTQIMEALKSATERRVIVEWSNDRFKTFETARSSDTEWTTDSTSQVRWYGKASIYAADRRINALTTWMRFYLLLRGVRMTEWFKVPMGVYRCETADLNGRITDVTFNGLEIIPKDHIFTSPRTLPVSNKATKRDTLELLIKESHPTAKIIWNSARIIKDASVLMTKMTVEQDRWSMIDGDGEARSISKSIAADCYANRVGTFVIDEVPMVVKGSKAVWSIERGEGVRVDSHTTSSRTSVKNLWSVWAEGQKNNKPNIIGPAYAWDANPTSPTYAGSNPVKFGARDASSFGVVPGRYQNPLIVDVKALLKVANARLVKTLGEQRKVYVTSIFNPFLDAGDIISMTPDGDQQPALHILDKATFRPDDAYTELDLRQQGAIDLDLEDQGSATE